jgi:hypothetical protein
MPDENRDRIIFRRPPVAVNDGHPLRLCAFIGFPVLRRATSERPQMMRLGPPRESNDELPRQNVKQYRQYCCVNLPVQGRSDSRRRLGR